MNFTLLNKKELIKYFIFLVSRIVYSDDNSNTVSRLIYMLLLSLIKFLTLVLYRIKK